jgi:D-serine deaminase-like pyridoxal phosphate-dependent protein
MSAPKLMLSVRQICYGFPIGADRLDDIAALSDVLAEHSAHFRVFVDTLTQVGQLEEYAKTHDRNVPWSVFIKVDGGYR